MGRAALASAASVEPWFSGAIPYICYISAEINTHLKEHQVLGEKTKSIGSEMWNSLQSFPDISAVPSVHSQENSFSGVVSEKKLL